ncbi:ATP-dependent RNA helicase DHX33-like isoform X2 [Hylaeus volcanicus]|nr:ATP-dependent RNA helicase DHX33-like isoform X2 [Hylaeus volcanicus]
MLGSSYTRSTIAITQPRRIAAISLANRVSHELKTYSRSRGFDHILQRDLNGESIEDEKTDIFDIGGIVGYAVRFQSKVSKKTRIKFVTDGIILREALINPLLSHYRIIIIDEAHERSVQTDTFLSFLKLLLERRKNLHIVIMSATLDYHSFTSFFGQGNVLMIPGRQHPVKIYQMCSSTNDPLDVLVDTIVQIHVSRDSKGDILAFLPGQEEIHAVLSLLHARSENLNNAFSQFTKWRSVIKKFKRVFQGQKKALNEFFLNPWYLKEDVIMSPPDFVPDNLPKCVSKSLRKCLSWFSSEDFIVLLKFRSAFLLYASQNKLGNVFDTCTPLDLIDSLVLKPSSFIVDETKTNDLVTEVFKDQIESFSIEGQCSMLIIPLYGSLPHEKQQLAFVPSTVGQRKIILSTNIAETSLTIPGITYVVDTGLYKKKVYNPFFGIEILKIEKISRAMANQRAGRAGREAPGECFRLYTEDNYFEMPVHLDPPIKNSDLTQVVLQLKLLGVTDVCKFPFISPPSDTLLKKAQDCLKKLGGINSSGITELGKRLSAFPLSPVYAKFLLDSIELKCTAEVLTLVSLLTTENILSSSWKCFKDKMCVENNEITTDLDGVPFKLAKKKVTSIYGDHLTLLNAYMMWSQITSTSKRISFCKIFGLNHANLCKARNIRNQLKAILLGPSIGLNAIASCLISTQSNLQHVENEGPDCIRRCLVKSFPSNIARLESVLCNNETSSQTSSVSTKYFIEESRIPVYIHPFSCLFKNGKKPEYIVFTDLVETTKLYARNVTSIESCWVHEYHPQLMGKNQLTSLSKTPQSFKFHDTFSKENSVDLKESFRTKKTNNAASLDLHHSRSRWKKGLAKTNEKRLPLRQSGDISWLSRVLNCQK